ncbi:glycoprotein precursor complex [Zaba virus]|nr:glycoprotein precursor complex [Zaba virus]
MIELILFFAQVILLVDARVSLTITSPDYSSLSCFNSAVPPKFMQRKWSTEVKKMGEFDHMCYFNNDIPKRSTGDNAQSLLTFTVLSSEPSTFSCVNEDRSKTAIIHSNGVKEDGDAAYIDCTEGSLIHLITVPDDHALPVNTSIHAEHDQLKRRFSELQDKFNEDLNKAKAENTELRASLSEIIESRDQLRAFRAEQEGNMTVLNSVIHDLNKKVRNGENALASALSQMRRDKESLIQLESDTDKRLEESESIIEMLKSKLRAASQAIPKLTTLAPVVVTVALLSASAVVADNRAHIDNRPGNGKYSKDSSSADTGCDVILYGSKCKGWQLQKNATKYPFFNSHYHKYSLLESMETTILANSERGICKVLNTSAQKYTECVKDLMPMKLDCPEGYKYGYYLNNKGTVSGIECDANYQLSTDCKMCVKATSNVKGALPLQDVFCQKGAVDYSGPVMNLRGVCSVGSKTLKECSKITKSYEKIPFITFDKKRKLYLDSLTIRNTEGKTPDNFLCHELKGRLGSSDHEHGEAALKRVDPKKCKGVNESETKICTGDPTFCSVYTCYKDYPDTMCELAPGAGPVEVLYGGVWTRPTCIGYENTVVGRESIKAMTPKEIPCTACVWSCEREGIRVTSHGFKMFSAVACAKGSCVSTHQEGSTEITVPYPGLSKMSGGKIGIHISHDDQSVSAHLVVRCKPKPACDIDDCILCFHGAINYQCHTVVSSLFVSVAIISMLMLSMWLLLKILRILKLAPYVTRRPVVWLSLVFKWVAKVCDRNLRQRIHGINTAIGWGEVERIELPRARNDRARPVQYYLYASAILMMLLPICSACTENVIASSKISRCTAQGGKTVCVLSGVVTLKAGTIGSEACIMIKGPTDDQVSFLSIKTISSDFVCHEGDSFWTNHYTPKCLSSRRCHLVSECTGNRCQTWDNQTVSKEFEHMTDNTLMTDNVCFEQCGAAGCGCFNINPSCLFGHSYLMPTRSEAVKVFECVSWSHRLVLEVSGPRVNKRQITLSALSTQIAEWGSITLSIDAENLNIGNTMSFLRTSSGAMALLDEPFPRIPRKGFIGEVRCSSEAHAARGDQSCLRAPDLIKYRPQLDVLECTSALVDPYAILLRNSLPQTRGNHVFSPSKDGFSVQAMTSGYINAEFTILLDSYEVEFLTSSVSCDAAFVNITGCYSCNEGSEVCVKAVSSGSGSFFAISDESRQAIQFPVQQGENVKCSMLHFSRPEVEEKFLYSCGGDKKPMIIRGTLIAVGPHDDRVAGGKSIVVNPKTSSWSVRGWFSGLVNWLGGPLRTAGLFVLYIAISIIIVVLLYFLLKFLISRSIMARRKML